MPEKQNGQIVETATEARAGERGPSVLAMLMLGTTSVIVLFAIVYLAFFSA